MRFKIITIAMFAVIFSGCAGTNTKPASETSSSTANADIQKVKGLNDIDGEIVGKPSASSKFKELKIGMSIQQVKSAIGEPSDQGEYESGKRWIPFYYGDDVRRTELVYKGQGRLTFASGSAFGSHGGALIRITHNANEAGTR
jgi:hypothetical protein